MKNITIETPNGYSVEIQEKIKFGQKRRLFRIMFGSANVDITTANPNLDDLEAVQLLDVQDEAVRLLVKKVTIDEQTYTGTSAYDVIQDMDEEDAQMIYDVVNDIALNEKKKGSKKK